MAVYTPLNWVANVTPLSETNMDHLETQYDSAVAEIVPATREFFVSFQFGANCVLGLGIGYYATWTMGDAADSVALNFIVPHDFTAITEAVIVYIEDDAANPAQHFDWTINTTFAAKDEAYDTHTDSDTADSLAVTEENYVRELDASTALTGLVAGDYVGLQFKIDALEANTTVYAMGLRFKYT